MSRVWIALGGIGGCTAVALDAADAHLVLGNPHAAMLVQTAARYLLIHSAALLAIGAFCCRTCSRLPTLAAALMSAGMLIFCGGLTLLALTGSALAAYSTPVGGVLLMTGWLTIGVYGFVAPSESGESVKLP